MQDFFTRPSGKRTRNDLTSQYNAGGYIPQQDGAGQDGAGDAAHGVFEIEVFFSPLLVNIIYISRMSAYLLVNC